MKVQHHGETLDATVHQSGGALVVELEPCLARPPLNPLLLVQGMVTRVHKAPDLAGFFQGITEEVRSATGFDRVMVYQFQPDDSGAVIAEAKHQDLEPLLGLRYPASDIPKQARDLYLLNRMRIIPDAHYTPVALTPALNPINGKPLDLSFSVLRSVSPLHLEYLANMGVDASMSLSLVIEGRLWGLIACHHRVPRYVPHAIRSACELFAQMISLQLGEKLLSEVQAERFRMKKVRAELVEAMVGQDDLGETLVNASPNLLDYIPAEGVAVWWEGKVTRHGPTPTDEQLGALVEWLNTSVPEGVFLTDCLASQFAPARNYINVASGLLALSVSRTLRDYVLWFRPEVSRTVTWAGNPAKPVDFTGDGLRPSPRKSFAAWKEIVREHSQPWGEPVADAAQALRLSILDVVLRHQDKVMREREKARGHQDFLMAELDHRVKNTLATIQALVKYTSSGAETLEEFAQKVQERVHAMARTHSQLTLSRWEGVNLRTLVAEQFAPFGERVIAAGPNLALRPKAALSISLAFHELMTNAAKYGALSVASGKVEINWRVKSGDGRRGLLFRWEERGGPPVAPPVHMGFGRMLLERSLAYDIDGEVTLDFRAEGLICEAFIPFAHIIGLEG
jgi:light-regulated signal transduction histidine kinase (bacteriophytochrome)